MPPSRFQRFDFVLQLASEVLGAFPMFLHGVGGVFEMGISLQESSRDGGRVSEMVIYRKASLRALLGRLCI